MAKEMVKHNLLNFPALKELPGLVWTEAKGSKTTKTKDGKETTEEWTFQYPEFTAAQIPAIVEILGPENLAAILTDEAKTIYRSAPTADKLRENAIAAMVRAGVERSVAESMFS